MTNERLGPNYSHVVSGDEMLSNFLTPFSQKYRKRLIICPPVEIMLVYRRPITVVLCVVALLVLLEPPP